MNFDNFEPKNIETFRKENSLHQIAFHEVFSAGINKKGEILVW